MDPLRKSFRSTAGTLATLLAGMLVSLGWSPTAFAEESQAQILGSARSQSPAPDEEIRRLRAYSAELLEQLRQIRDELAASERARKQTEALLAETSRRSRDQLQEKQANYARETVRREKEVTTTLDQLAALKAEEERQAARAAELAAALDTLRHDAAQGEAEKKKLAAEITGLEQARDAALRSQAAALEARDRDAKQMAARLDDAERVSRDRTKDLERRKQDLAAVQSQLDGFKARLDEAERVSRDRSKDLERRKQDLVAAQSQLDGLKAEKQRATQLASEVEKLRGQASAQAARKEELEVELARLSHQATQRRHEEAENLKARASDVEKIRQELEAAREEGQRRLEKLEQQERDLAAARLQLQGLQQDTEQRQHEATKLGGEIEKLQAAARQRETEAAQAKAASSGADADSVSIGSLQRKLEDEKQSSRSKLEALQSVLRNTRSASAAVHSELEAARQENAILSRQVAELRTGMSEVHDLQARFKQKELRIQEIAQRKHPDPRELGSLRADQRSIEAKLREARSKQEARADSLSKLLAAEPSPAPADAPSAAQPAADRADGDAGDIREQLSIERERRETLEGEVRRLTLATDPEERSLEVWKALQSARAEILVLGNQLVEERRSREDLEVAVTRMTQGSGVKASSAQEFAERLATALRDRRADADRLAEELKNANDVITRLKGRLEANASTQGEASAVAELEQENWSLRQALGAAEEANRSLRTKAELAERLAGMIYGKAQ